MIRTLAEVSVSYATPSGPMSCTISGEWHGGAYVDLTFGLAATPTEVINVWDYRTSAPVIDRTPDALQKALEEWVVDQDEEELRYRLSDYSDPADLEEVRSQWATQPERAWLLNYIANSR